MDTAGRPVWGRQRIAAVKRGREYPKLYLFKHPLCQMLRMGALRQAPRDKVYLFRHPACQMLRMGALRQAPRDKV